MLHTVVTPTSTTLILDTRTTTLLPAINGIPQEILITFGKASSLSFYVYQQVSDLAIRNVKAEQKSWQPNGGSGSARRPSEVH